MADKRICSVAGCGKNHFGRGYCRTHYARWAKHGDPLVTVQTPAGELLRFYREVVVPYEGDECLEWPYSRSSSGYARFHADGRDQNVSRALCEEINGPPPTPTHEAAHSCGRGHFGCVTKRHLSWKTPKQNIADQLVHGTRLRGERQNGAKLTEAEVRDIRAAMDERPSALARKYGVTHGNIIAIWKRKSWYWLPD